MGANWSLGYTELRFSGGSPQDMVYSWVLKQQAYYQLHGWVELLSGT